MTDRDQRIRAFLVHAGWAEAAATPLAGDASQRRYTRLARADGDTVLLVETPVPAEDLAPFVAIGGILSRLGFSTPRVLAVDLAAGLALEEDFGDDTFARRLDLGDDPVPLYELATDVLIELHRRIPADSANLAGLPVFNAEVFADQVMLYADVAAPAALGRPLEAEERDDFRAAWRGVLAGGLGQARSLLLRDYFAGNLMSLPRPGLAAAGLIDFQSAGAGPRAYDLLSLVEDARRDLPPGLPERMVERYLDAFPTLDADDFRRSYAVLGAVRHARVVGIFVRMAVERKRREYLPHLPRVVKLLEAKFQEPGLAPVARWFDRILPPQARAEFSVPEAD